MGLRRTRQQPGGPGLPVGGWANPTASDRPVAAGLPAEDARAGRCETCGC